MTPRPHGASLRKFLSLVPHMLHTSSPKGQWGSEDRKEARDFQPRPLLSRTSGNR